MSESSFRLASHSVGATIGLARNKQKPSSPQTMAIDKDQLITAIKATNGNITAAAKSLGCSTAAVYLRRKNDDDIATAIDDSRAQLDHDILDTAESKLLSAIEAGEPWAIKFALSTKGRERGYTEKLQLDHSGEIKQITMVMDIAPRSTDSDFDGDAAAV